MLSESLPEGQLNLRECWMNHEYSLGKILKKKKKKKKKKQDNRKREWNKQIKK